MSKEKSDEPTNYLLGSDQIDGFELANFMFGLGLGSSIISTFDYAVYNGEQNISLHAIAEVGLWTGFGLVAVGGIGKIVTRRSITRRELRPPEQEVDS